MQGWVKSNRIQTAVLLCVYLFSAQTVAGEFSAQIKNINFTEQDGWYLLNADIEHLLSPVAKEAVQSSIPLKWCLKIRLKQLGYFYNSTVQRTDYHYTIRYHALLNNYGITNSSNPTEKKYASLAQALEALSQIRNLKIIPSVSLSKTQLYQVQLKLKFNKEQLPPPLRPVAYLNSDWDLSSGWYVWTLQKN